MTFNKDYMSPNQQRKPYFSPGCTGSEPYFLEEVLLGRTNHLSLAVYELPIMQDLKQLGMVNIIQKQSGDPTCLVIKSDQPDLEGLVLWRNKHNPLSLNNIVRYIYGGVFLDPVRKIASIEVLLAELGLEYPTCPGVLLGQLIDSLAILNNPVGSHFKENCDGMANWLNQNHSVLANSAWPTPQDIVL